VAWWALEVIMAKMLRCSDVNAGCDTVIYGRDIDEVVFGAENHVRHDHNMTIIPPGIVEEIIDHISDAPDAPPHWWDSIWPGRKAG
jgi:predicted small metal-binding protein